MDEPLPEFPPIRLERHAAAGQAVRWRKTLSPLYPAAGYWLCHEARIFQEFHNGHPHVARFVSVDVEQRTLVVEAEGFTLAQLLNTPAEGLQHPFQRSSDLIRLLRAVCLAVDALHAKGVIHGGLRLDDILLSLTAEGRVDFGTVKLMDFSAAHSLLHRIEKPPYLDPDVGGGYFSEALQKALVKDWALYARLCGEEGRCGWNELSDKARRRYEEMLIPTLSINQVDWRCDLHALGYWFRQLSLRRIDYYRDSHQEHLPKLLKRMQKTPLLGGFGSLLAVVRELDTLELDPETPCVTADPSAWPLECLAPLPKAAMPPPAMAEAAPGPRPMPSLGGSRPAIQAAASVRRQPVGKRRLPAWLTWKKGVALAVVAAWAAAWLLVSGERSGARAPGKAVARPVVAIPAPAAAPAPPVRPAPPVEPEPLAKPEADAAPADDKGAFAYYLRRAESGDAAAQARVGQSYREGRGVAQDFPRAVKWYRKAAEAGNADAQARLGYMYMAGLGVKKSDAEAAKWLRKAADQGSALGQYNLGLLYMNGRGVPSDPVQAYMWFKLAASSDVDAREKLRTLTLRMNNLDMMEGERLADEWRAGHKTRAAGG
jgi:hypothetical protein